MADKQHPIGDQEDLADDDTAGDRVRGPLSAVFAPDPYVWEEARRLVSDKNVRVESLALCAAQDPVIVIELLRVSNAMYYSAGRAPITSAKTAIVRLGSELVMNILNEIGSRPRIENHLVSQWFEVHRNRCKRTAILSRMLAEIVAKNFVEDCHSAGLLMFVGEMIAVHHFQEEYVSLALELSRSGVKYRLTQEHGFNVEKMGIKYLHRNGIPEALLFAVDFEGQPRVPERALIKPTIWAAAELVEAFDTNRWEKFAPGKALPAKSPLRLLKIGDGQYLKIYERASEYLFSSRLLEERRRRDATGPATDIKPAGEPMLSGTISLDRDKAALASEIHDLLKSSNVAPVKEEVSLDKTAPRITTPITSAKDTTAAPADSSDQFSLKASTSTPKRKPRKESTAPVVAPPTLRSARGQKTVESLNAIIDAATNSEDLLTNALAMLVDNGPFEKAALIVVSKDRKNALVVCARGPIGNGQRLALDDPLSPLAQCFSKLQSFGNQSSANSPFGSKSYALAPLDADHDTPVALYADCGNDGSIAFDSRRVFRTVVDLLNQKLPTLPGGIPVEVAP